MSPLSDEDLDQYRPVSALAIVALVFGLLSSAALLDTTAWILPPIGAVLSGWALWRIAHGPAPMVGRKAALAGLLLAVVFGAASVSHWYAARWLICRQARQFTMVWFDALRHHEPKIAYALTLPPDVRQPAEGKASPSDQPPSWRMSFKDYLTQPLVEFLLNQGERAQVRYCRTETLVFDQLAATVHQRFAVTAPKGDGKTTLEVTVELYRIAVDKSGLADWYISNAAGVAESQALPEH